MGFAGKSALGVAAIALLLHLVVPGAADDPPPEALKGHLLGLPAIAVPAENGPAAAKQVELGRKLFFDARLSPSGGMSCATCHVPEDGFTQTDRARATGSDGKPLKRNAPTLLNASLNLTFFHDGRAITLEEQAVMPFVDPREFAAPSIEWVVGRINALDDYDGLFAGAFNQPASADGIGRALAAFQRRLTAADSPFDRWFFGKQKDAVSPAAQRGFKIFREDGLCSACHRIDDDHATFTDDRFHDTGIAWRNAQSTRKEDVDRGREEATGLVWDRFKIKTPSLRNVALTAPYMHDGSVATLEDSVRFYVKGGVDHPTLSALIGPLELSEGDIADLVAFLESLTSPHVKDVAAWARGENK